MICLKDEGERFLRNKRVVIVLGTLAIGGTERQALYLAEHLVNEEKSHVEVLGLSRHGLAAKRLDQLGITWKIVPFRWPCRKLTLLKTLPRFLWQLRQARPDIILSYNSWANIACGLTWRLSGARTCIWNQRDVGHDLPKGNKLEEKYASRLVSGFISNSEAGAGVLANRLNIDRKRISVIHNGVRFRPRVKKLPNVRSFIGVDQNCLLSCMVANLRYPKDHETLVLAWRKVVDRMDQEGKAAILLLVGRFEDMYGPTKSLVDRLNLRYNVRFMGEIGDVEGILAQVDLGIFVSLAESFPNAVLECMAARLPLVATDIPGIREAVGPGGYEYLVPARNYEILAQRIIVFLTNPTLRSAVGKRNLRRVNQEFSLDEMLELTVGTIDEYAMGRKKGVFS